MKSLPYVEMALINAIRSAADIDAIEQANPIFGHAERHWYMVRDYVRRFDKPPPIGQLQAEDAGWQETDGDFAYWMAEWLESRKHFALRKAMMDALEVFEGAGPA